MKFGIKKIFLALFVCMCCAAGVGGITASAWAYDIYTHSPSYLSPYSAGTVRQEVLDEALAELNYIRKLAGVPDDLTHDSDYANKAQHGAVLMDVNDVMSHYPVQPADMPDDFYRLGYEGTSKSNIFYSYRTTYNGVKTGNANLLTSLKFFMDDSDERNIVNLGHRRWLLNPPMKKTGFGISTRYGYVAIYVLDTSRETSFNYDYIAWPVKTQHPLSYFGATQAWSVTLNSAVYAKCSADVSVSLTRQRDGKEWNFGAAGSDGYFNVSDSVYEDCVIFRPDGVDGYQSGDSYLVEVTGLKKLDGSSAAITYTTTFAESADAPQGNNNESGGGGCNSGLNMAGILVLVSALSGTRVKNKTN